ncbi:MAG TPA: alanine racemase [Dermatophilaceae bacterium]|nr:alanine racemase [Dermatophilaceae bacterium]
MQPLPGPGLSARLSRATANLRPLLAVVDVDAFDRNAARLVGRGHGKPIRVATKSLRARALIERALTHDGWRGLMCYSVAEAVSWARAGHTDVLVAYPSVDRQALAELARDPGLASAVTLMVDSVDHLDLLAALPGHDALRVAVDVDASLRMGPAHIGARRSPLRTAADVTAVIRHAKGLSLSVVGLMFYDAQIAGIPDHPVAMKGLKRRSHHDLLTRRSEIVSAARQLTDLELVNGGGTGSLHVTGEDPALTELAAGSGLYAPTLFDGYDGLDLEPAAFFATPVVRRPAPDIVTTYGGGYIASGPPGWSRVPTPLPDQGLSLLRTEGAGEVQTPLRGRGAARLRLGDRVWFRHAKAGELAERFNELVLVAGDRAVGTVPTYRGDGANHG